ncbi:MAG: DegT/DnrJ/EryC1/StrS family aminotransferase [Bacteroidota bacterium]
MDKIRMVDLHGQYLKIKNEVDQRLSEVLDQTAFINGPEVKEFAFKLGEYLESNVIPCANGTDALQIAIMALDTKPGDEVILPAYTYVATAEVIALLRLKPVFVDVDPQLFTINVEQVESNITSKTKAIFPVHLFGQCAEMEGLLDIIGESDIAIIEDNAQAIGADYQFKDGRINKAGTLGTIGTTSFFPSKNLGCFGDGGAMITNDPKMAEKLRVLANHGQYKKYHHDIIGVNSRLDTVQSAVLLAKLPRLDDYNQYRQQVAARYDELLEDLDEVRTPARANYSTHVFHQYTIQVSHEVRDALKEHLLSNGIPSMIYYPIPLHLQKGYEHYGYKKGSFPISEYLSGIVLSLPIHTELTDEQQLFICDKIRNFFKR